MGKQRIELIEKYDNDLGNESDYSSNLSNQLRDISLGRTGYSQPQYNIPDKDIFQVSPEYIATNLNETATNQSTGEEVPISETPYRHSRDFNRTENDAIKDTEEDPNSEKGKDYIEYLDKKRLNPELTWQKFNDDKFLENDLRIEGEKLVYNSDKDKRIWNREHQYANLNGPQKLDAGTGEQFLRSFNNALTENNQKWFYSILNQNSEEQDAKKAFIDIDRNSNNRIGYKNEYEQFVSYFNIIQLNHHHNTLSGN